jgi:hypothetical protein
MRNKIHGFIQDLGYVASVLIPIAATIVIVSVLFISGLIYFGL